MKILEQIREHKRAEVDARKKGVDPAALRQAARSAPPPRGFERAIRGPRAAGDPRLPGLVPRLIAEVKRASPSVGLIREDFDPVAIAQSYARGGATAISCLTDEAFFKGSLDDLKQIRAAVDLPVLRKEFILDPFQVWEARAAGADAILLIAGFVEWPLLRDLRAEARRAGLDVLLEVHAQDELEPALELEPDLLGINNRDLRSEHFTTDLAITELLAAEVPPTWTLVSESGIRTPEDVARLARVGVDGILVGEHLMRAPDPGAAIRERLGIGPRASR